MNNLLRDLKHRVPLIFCGFYHGTYNTEFRSIMCVCVCVTVHGTYTLVWYIYLVVGFLTDTHCTTVQTMTRTSC